MPTYLGSYATSQPVLLEAIPTGNRFEDVELHALCYVTKPDTTVVANATTTSYADGVWTITSTYTPDATGLHSAEISWYWSNNVDYVMRGYGLAQFAFDVTSDSWVEGEAGDGTGQIIAMDAWNWAGSTKVLYQTRDGTLVCKESPQ